MNQSDSILAPLLITEDMPCMAIISEGFIHIFTIVAKGQRDRYIVPAW